MPVDSAIATALFEHLDSLSSPPPDIAYPGVVFDVPEDGHLRATFMPTDPVALSVDFGGTNRHQGLLQVDIFRPVNTSEITMREAADEIAEHFARGTRLTSSGFQIDIIEPPTVGPFLSEEAYNMLPVRIRWRCLAANP